MHILWTKAEQRKLLCSYRKVSKTHPSHGQHALIKMAQAVLPKERRQKVDQPLIRWIAENVAKTPLVEMGPPATLTGLAQQLFPHVAPASIGIAAKYGVGIASSVVAGVLANPEVRGAIVEAIGRGLSQYARSRKVVPQGRLPQILVVGVSDDQASRLPHGLGSRCQICYWHEGMGIAKLATGGARASLVLALESMGPHAALVLRESGHDHIHHARSMAELRSTLLSVRDWLDSCDSNATSRPRRLT